MSELSRLSCARFVLKRRVSYRSTSPIQFERDPFRQGEDERTKIGISIQDQLNWGTDEGFRHWRAVIERLGISVYLQNFETADCRGCALWDEGGSPAILINKTERSENG